MKNKKSPSKRGIIIYITAVILTLLAILTELLYETFGIKKVADYMYSANCSVYSYSLANWALENNVVKLSAGGCSTVKKGDIAGRNFDWLYDDETEFVVTTPKTEERYASIGVAGATGIKSANAGSFVNLPLFYMLPFYTVDGINENGVFVSTNEVPAGDAGYTTGTNPGGERLCSAMISRYVLDYAASAREAVELLREKDIYACIMDGVPYEVHVMIADRTESLVVEFIDNEMVVVEDASIMTNFYLAAEDYTPHAEGVERYELLKEGYGSLEDEDSVHALLKKLWYSNLYDADTTPSWLSEYYGELSRETGEELTIDSDTGLIEAELEADRALYTEKKRDATFWNTNHTSVYNLKRLSLSLSVQEESLIYDFDLENTTALESYEEETAGAASIMIHLETICLLVMLVILYGLFFESSEKDKKTVWFIVIVLTCILALVSDLVAWSYSGFVAVQWIANFMAMIMGGILAIPFLFYEYEYICERKKVTILPAVIFAAYNVAFVLVLLVLSLLGKTFYFENGVYYTGDMYWLNVAINLANLVYILVTVLRSHRVIGRHDTAAFLVYGFIPLLATAFEVLDSQLELGFVAAGFSVLFLYISLQTGHENELRIRQRVLEELCYNDQLTGLKNRRAYEEQVERVAGGDSAGIVFCDVNGLKLINDRMGHKAGDELIKKFGGLLKSSFGDDNVYRISGDEFVAIITDKNSGEFFAVSEEFAAVVRKNGECGAIGSAFGEAAEVRRLIMTAEKLMYEAKADYYSRHPEFERRHGAAE